MELIKRLNNLLESRFSEKGMATIARLLLELASNDAIRSEVSGLNQCVESFTDTMEKDDPSSLEYALLGLYIRLHSAGAEYTPSEKERLVKRKGYSCLPGGLSPLIMAERFIRPESIVADLGAGNGLQGLLLQRLYPHQRTLQVELSSEMIRIGRIFQQVLGISSDRVEWIHEDMINVSIEDADFVYIYRPAKPLDSGKDLYQTIARKLAAVYKPLVVFSVADCLSQFLDEKFSVIYTDGHLTCFAKK